MDPFSLIVGVGSLVDLSIKLGKYLRDVREAVASFEEEMGFLLGVVESISSINKSIEDLYKAQAAEYIGRSGLQIPDQEYGVWQNIAKTLQSCSAIIQKLQDVLQAVVGKKDGKVAGVRDAIKRQLRKQARDGELSQIQIKLSSHRDFLNLSLTNLNVIYSQKGSKEIQKFGFQLQRQIASLHTRLAPVDIDTFHESFHSATAVASTLHLNKHFDTPKTVTGLYTGRQSYLDDLKHAFDVSQSLPENGITQKRFVVYGIGGSGKTQFCCKFASEYKQRFWGVFTIDASSSITAQQSFIAIAKACGTDPNERAAKSWLSSCDRPWLLLIDNADDTNLEIENYFPENELGLILITTRNPSFKMHGTIGERFFHLDKLDDGEASDLLLKAADHHEPRTPSTMQLALAIIKKLGALPLAIVHAGKSIKANYCELTNYIPRLESTLELVRRSRGFRRNHQDEDDDFLNVYSSYEIVFSGLEKMESESRRYRDALQLLQLFSFLHHEHVPFRLLTAAIEYPKIQREADARDANDRDAIAEGHSSFLHTRFWTDAFQKIMDFAVMAIVQLQYPVILPAFIRDTELEISMDDMDNSAIRLRKALHCLTELSLVTHYEATDSYSMHPVVHMWVRKRPKLSTWAQAIWCETARQTISRAIVLPPLGYLVDRDTELTRRLLPHIIALTGFQRTIDRDMASNREKRRKPWPVLQMQLSPWTAMFLAKSAFVYFECGEWKKSEDCLRTVLQFNRKLLGETHDGTERIILGLREVMWHQGNVNESAQLTEQTLRHYQRVLGQDHMRTLQWKSKLGELRRQQGRFAESLELLYEAKSGLEQQLPGSDPKTCQALWELGTTLRYCYCLDDALQCHERAVKGLKLRLGETDVLTLFAIEELAITHEELGTKYVTSQPDISRRHFEIAEKYATWVLEQRIRQVGPRQLTARYAQGLLARIKAAIGRFDEADTLYTTLVPMVVQDLGSDHLGLLNQKTAYAKLFVRQKRYKEAEKMLLDLSSPARWKTVRFVGDHPDRWDVLWTRVKCYEEQGQFDRSLAVCGELLNAMDEIRAGRLQTETSSIFWNMVRSKKEELLALKGSGTGRGSGTGASSPQSAILGSVVSQPSVQARPHNAGSMEAARLGDFRHRGTTW